MHQRIHDFVCARIAGRSHVLAQRGEISIAHGALRVRFGRQRVMDRHAGNDGSGFSMECAIAGAEAADLDRRRRNYDVDRVAANGQTSWSCQRILDNLWHRVGVDVTPLRAGIVKDLARAQRSGNRGSTARARCRIGLAICGVDVVLWLCAEAAEEGIDDSLAVYGKSAGTTVINYVERNGSSKNGTAVIKNLSPAARRALRLPKGCLKNWALFLISRDRTQRDCRGANQGYPSDQ